MTQRYPQTKYILHWCVIRVIVVGPFAIMRAISETIFNFVDKVTEYVSDALPVPYTKKWVEWDQLSSKEQEAIKKVARARDVMLSQVQVQ